MTVEALGFLGELGDILALAEEYGRLRERLLEERLKGWGYVSLPFPPLQPGISLKLRFDVEGEAPEPLALLAGGRPRATIKGVEVKVAGDSITLSAGGLGVVAELGPRATVGEVAAAALLHRFLLERGIDVFDRLEKELLMRGAFAELRQTLDLAASFLTS
ncbi:MAG: hypothetical protein QXJ59_06195 [Thermofilaceae archaeon]